MSFRLGSLGVGFGRLGGGGSLFVDPLAPPAPSLDLVAGSDSGSSSTDNITSDTTPDIDITFGSLPLEDDIVYIYDSGVEIVDHTVTALEASSGTISLGLSALSDGVHSLTAKHSRDGHISRASSGLSVTVDTTAPTITTSSTANCAENATLSVALAADETVAWTITGGADQALFEISNTTLRWASNGTKNYENPDDADTNNTYVVQVTATDPAGNATNKTITVTVTDVAGPTMTSGTTANCAENATLSFALTASETSTFAITGGADQARFEISGSTLRWASNGTKNFESPNDDNTNNTYVVEVTPTSTAGEVGTPQTITITVTDVNEAPTVANALVNQTATVGAAFSYQFASNSFADVDAGDSLTYSAALVGGGSLPSWLTFTSGTRTFSGTPASGDIGTISIRVTATDSGSLTVTDDFDIVTSEVSDITIELTDQSFDTTDKTAGQTWTFSTQAIGTNAGSDILIVGAGLRSTATPGITSVTVGGSGATLVGSASASGRTVSALYVIAHPGGTTADVVVTTTDVASNCGIAIWRMTGAGSSTASDTGGSTAGDPMSDTLTVSAGGVLVGFSYVQSSSGSPTCTWTNITEDFDQAVEAGLYAFSGASLESSGGGSITPTADWSGTIAAGSAAFAAWEP